MRHLSFFLCLILLLTLVSCKEGKDCHIAIGDANCQIEPTSPLYPGLNNVGGYEYIVGGNQGIIVIHNFLNEYYAFERSCPYDEGRLEMYEGYNNIVLCPICGSLFLLDDQNSQPLNITDKPYCTVYQYSTYFDGRILYISNW